MRRILMCGLWLLAIACGAEDPVRSPTTPTAPSSPIPPTQPTTFTLSGTVRDEAGAPLQGARVTVGYDPRRAGFGSAETDARGQYRVTGLLRGESPYGVSKPGYIFISGAVSIGEETVKDFTMRPGVVIGGRIDENGVGPLGDVTITVVSGPNAGTQTKSTSWGAYGLPPIAPGESVLRASKEGYDSVERTIHAVNDALVNFTLKWAYGTCLTSVAPVLVDRFTSAGGTVQVAVSANPDRTWTSTTDTPWIEMLTGTGRGGGTARFRVLPHPTGAFEARSGAVMIRCSATEGQRVLINQLPNCETNVQWHPSSPQTFPASGGSGRLVAQNGVRGCRSQDASEVSWITLAGAGSYMTGEVAFIVHANATGVARTGTIAVGETRWQVVQQGQ